MWEDILKFLGALGIGTTAIGILAKQILGHLLNRDLERYRNTAERALETFRREAEKDLEKLRAELRLVELRYSRLHKEQAKAIAEVYACLGAVHGLIGYYADPKTPAEEKRRQERKAKEKLASLYETFGPRRLYFPKHLSNDLEALCREYDQIMAEADKEQSLDGLIDGGNLAWRNFKNRIPPILDKLEDEFRRLLGHESETPQREG